MILKANVPANGVFGFLVRGWLRNVDVNAGRAWATMCSPSRSSADT
jgi:hypothetical protein